MIKNNTGLDTDTVDTVKISEVVRERLRKNGVRFFANDNISEHISEFELQEIQNEMQKEIKEQDLNEILELETNLFPMLVDMTFKGVRVDLEKAAKIKKDFAI